LDHRYALCCGEREKQRGKMQHRKLNTQHATNIAGATSTIADKCIRLCFAGHQNLRGGSYVFFYTTQRALGYFYSWGMWANRTPALCTTFN